MDSTKLPASLRKYASLIDNFYCEEDSGDGKTYFLDLTEATQTGIWTCSATQITDDKLRNMAKIMKAVEKEVAYRRAKGIAPTTNDKELVKLSDEDWAIIEGSK